EEIGDRGGERPRHLPELRGAHPVGRTLIFLHLLEGEADRVGEPFLAPSQFLAAHSNAEPHMAVHGVWPLNGIIIIGRHHSGCPTRATSWRKLAPTRARPGEGSNRHASPHGSRPDGAYVADESRAGDIGDLMPR